MNRLRQKVDATHKRIRLVGALLMALFLVAVVRAVDLQVNQAEWLQGKAAIQYSKKVMLLPARGKIFDRNMGELAATVSGSSAYAASDRLLEYREEFDRICATLGLNKAETTALIKKRGQNYTTIKRRLTPAEEEAAKALAANSKFFGVAPQPVRYYPNKFLAGNILGYVNTDGVGLGGLEIKYEEVLKGTPVWVNADKDAKFDALLTEAPDAAKARGKSLVLTIDRNIQHIVEEELERAVEERGAKGGFSIMIEPSTGEILALAQVPRLNPNESATTKPEDLKIKTVSDVYEPGSTMKPLFISMLLQAGAIKPSELVFCEYGKWKVFGKVIHDHSGHGVMGLADVIKVSSNIGVAKLSQKISKNSLHERLSSYGFGKSTGIELKGESKGILPQVNNWSKITPMTMAYGHGISVTPVQMAAAYASLANGGVMMQPHLVKAILDQNGNEIERIEPKELGRPVSPEIAEMVMRWMELVVMDPGGTANAADGSGYTAAGKTGTAWKPSKGGYDTSKVVASFVGVAPSRNPRVVTFVALDEPSKGSSYGGVVAAPVFRDITRRVLTYMSVPPDRPVKVVEKKEKKPSKEEKEKDKKKKGEEAEEVLPEEGLVLTDPVDTRGLMPDLNRLTMREALKKLEAIGTVVSLDLRGSGFVVHQDPPPGMPVNEGAICVITFDANQELASAEAQR